MAAPLTPTQLPQEAILDVFGKQNYLGNSFVLPMPGATLTDATEVPIAVIRNPVGSGKSLFLFNKKVTTNGDEVFVRFYKNPVLNVPGSTTTPINTRFGSPTTSISQCYLGATISSNGTFIAIVPALALLVNTDLLYIIDPGTSLLITAQQATSDTTIVVVETAWYEI